jgi:CheY-like chemotaxis protein
MTRDRPAPAQVSLKGLSVLVVEDETMVSFLIEDMLTELGCSTVLQAGRVSEALALLDKRRPDAAVLDVNLAGEPAYPVAARLAELRVPFMFTTGYGPSGISSEWASRPVVQKPFSLDAFAAALRMAMPDLPITQQ